MLSIGIRDITKYWFFDEVCYCNCGKILLKNAKEGEFGYWVNDKTDSYFYWMDRLYPNCDDCENVDIAKQRILYLRGFMICPIKYKDINLDDLSEKDINMLIVANNVETINDLKKLENFNTYKQKEYFPMFVIVIYIIGVIMISIYLLKFD